MAKTKRNLSTTIRMGAGYFDVTIKDKDTGEVGKLDLSQARAEGKGANGYDKHQIAKLVCDLHGIKAKRPVKAKPDAATQSFRKGNPSKRIEVSIPRGSHPAYPVAAQMAC